MQNCSSQSAALFKLYRYLGSGLIVIEGDVTRNVDPYAIVAGIPARVVENQRDVRADSAVVKT
jgi:acetyltransferase-like isoleucine patch superfamily enzyme